MSSPFGGDGVGGPGAAPSTTQYGQQFQQNPMGPPQAYQPLQAQHLQAPQQVGLQPLAQAGMPPGSLFGNNSSADMASLPSAFGGPSVSLDFGQLIGTLMPTPTPSGTLPLATEALQQQQQQYPQLQLQQQPPGGVMGPGMAPPAPMFAPMPPTAAPAPAFQLLDPEGKRNRSSGLTNMMVVPDGKAQRVKSGNLQQGPLMAAMVGSRAPAAVAAAGAAAPPVEVTKEVKSHTARSLLRMLRAGTGVKTPNNIPITEAERIIKQLAGEFAPEEVMQKKKRNAGREALSVLLTMYLQKPVTMAEAAACHHNPYNRGLEPTPYLFDLLGEKTWPPFPEDKPAKPPSAAKSRPTPKKAVKPRAPVPTFDSGARQQQQQKAAAGAPAVLPPSSTASAASPFSAAAGSSSSTVAPAALQPPAVSYAPPAAIESPFAGQTQPPSSPFEQQGDVASGEGFGGFRVEPVAAAGGRTGGPASLNLSAEEAQKLRDASLSGLLASKIGIGGAAGASGHPGGASAAASVAAAVASSEGTAGASGDAAAGVSSSSREGGDSALLPSLSGLGGLFGGTSGAPSGLGGQTLSGLLGSDFGFSKGGSSLSGLLPDLSDNPRAETLSGILSFGGKDSSWQEITKAANRAPAGPQDKQG